MVSSIARSIPVASQRIMAPNYHLYVSSMLHRRWMKSCLWVLGIAYVESVLTSMRGSNWLFSLLTVAVVKALIVWLATLPVMVMRIHLVHLGAKTEPSVSSELKKKMGSFNTYLTFLSYMASSTTFVIMYMFTSDDSAQLGITIEGKSHERPRLNERCLYLLYLSFHIAFVHTISHMSSDRDRIDLPSVPLSSAKAGERGKLSTENTVVNKRIMDEATGILKRAGQQSIFTVITALVAYLVPRRYIWANTLKVARLFYRISNIAHPNPYPVGFKFFFRTFWVAMLVFTIWETAHTTFRVYFSMDPLKRERTLSSDSRDPNGTLVTGLKSNKPFTRAIAFWELCYIAHNEPLRRKAMLMEIDRSRAIWDDVLEECLRVLEEALTSVAYVDEPAPTSVAATSIAESPLKETPATTSANALASDLQPWDIPPYTDIQRTVRDDDMFITPVKDRTTPTKLGFLKSREGGMWNGGGGVAMETLKDMPAPITPNVAALGNNFLSDINNVTVSFMKSQAGRPFRQTVERKTAALIPNVALQINAVSALAKFVQAALKEDEYGLVARYVPKFLEKVFETIDVLEGYVTKPPVHWTDVVTQSRIEGNGEAAASKNGADVTSTTTTTPPVKSVELKEPEMLLEVLRTAAREVADRYRPYLDDMGMNLKLVRRTKEVMSKEAR